MPAEYLPIITAAAAGFAMLMIVLGVAAYRSQPALRTRLNQYLTTGEQVPITSSLDIELAEPFFKRVIAPILRRLLNILGWMWPKKRVEQLRHRLLLAGHPSGLTTSDFIGLKGWCAIIVGGGGVLFGYLTNYPRSNTAFLMLGLLTLTAFFLPDFWLGRRVTLRQRDIVRTLPDVLDMLTVAMEAGLSFENSVIEITQRYRNTLSAEFMRVQRDIGMGQARREALQGLSYRTGVPDIEIFVSAINQAEELGISIVKVLSTQAEEMRIKRRQRAQEAANKAPIKMLFPLAFLIFPALFAVILGPGIMKLVNLGGV
jgi:tight adherence protein C